jgi:cob(I)alamin adenosyltransferase
MKKSNLYTKTGDNGFSSLYNGTRASKTSAYFQFLGCFDELNCNLGLTKAFWNEELEKSEFKLYNAPGAGGMFYKTEKAVDSGKYFEWFAIGEIITRLQCNIMDISTFVATPPYDQKHPLPTEQSLIEDSLTKWVNKVGFPGDHIKEMENLIDRLDSLTPPIKNFVVPGGNKLSSQIHICRALSRNCERIYLDLCETVNKEYFVHSLIKQELIKVGIYLNRLSDLLFAMSRFVVMTLEIKEDLYSKKSGVK